ncbi:MAG: ThiF family adenylyltransferase [Alphaproteobacteria bacterium]
MSHQLINRSADLKRLRDEGYHVEVRDGFLFIHDVPYVNASRKIARGTLASKLTLAGDRTAKPDDHIAYFIGDHPCNADGTEISKIKHASGPTALVDGLIAHHSFSAKPTTGSYNDYHHKMETYAAILSSQAQKLDPTVKATSDTVLANDSSDGPFRYVDTASSRAEIVDISMKLALPKIGIVGLGGTGSYVLDLVAKTPVSEIHLFDGDHLLQHNAFRSPGAASLEELERKPFKSDYFLQIYCRMHKGIRSHPVYIEENNLDLLDDLNFAFLCLDSGKAKSFIISRLEARNIPFIDVGMGLFQVDDRLGGIVRLTTSTPSMREHVHTKKRIPMHASQIQNIYERNIQIADLNALNAALAVIKWKKLQGFYLDLECEHFTTYTVDGNVLMNEDVSK